MFLELFFAQTFLKPPDNSKKALKIIIPLHQKEPLDYSQRHIHYFESKAI